MPHEKKPHGHSSKPTEPYKAEIDQNDIEMISVNAKLELAESQRDSFELSLDAQNVHLAKTIALNDAKKARKKLFKQPQIVEVVVAHPTNEEDILFLELRSDLVKQVETKIVKVKSMDTLVMEDVGALRECLEYTEKMLVIAKEEVASLVGLKAALIVEKSSIRFNQSLIKEEV